MVNVILEPHVIDGRGENNQGKKSRKTQKYHRIKVKPLTMILPTLKHLPASPVSPQTSSTQRLLPPYLYSSSDAGIFAGPQTCSASGPMHWLPNLAETFFPQLACSQLP